jgi:hypothetical protein
VSICQIVAHDRVGERGYLYGYRATLLAQTVHDDDDDDDAETDLDSILLPLEHHPLNRTLDAGEPLTKD